ncbi:glutathione S-transferase family protein [Devosia sp. LC5]|uniref:glutathione S-transferase family protein n=1 Tax=Devosia sp. LC5 TaxID=1502724 RepID=UPI0005505D5A|nr:glutathione S-transferase family protein [Devosia sp. LC5]
MILFGGKLSPFVRRVAISLTLQGRPFERQIVNVLQSDFGGITDANPLGRVPVLRLDDGTDLIETSAIIDYLDQTAQEGKRLFPANGPARIAQLQTAGYANGVAEKGVALVYEAIRRPAELQWPDWRARLGQQITAGLDHLETLAASAEWPANDHPRGAIVAMVCAYDFIATAHPALTQQSRPVLAALSARANALSAFAGSYPLMT